MFCAGTGFVSPADLPMSDDEDEQEDQEVLRRREKAKGKRQKGSSLSVQASFIFGGLRLEAEVSPEGRLWGAEVARLAAQTAQTARTARPARLVAAVLHRTFDFPRKALNPSNLLEGAGAVLATRPSWKFPEPLPWGGPARSASHATGCDLKTFECLPRSCGCLRGVQDDLRSHLARMRTHSRP